MTTAYCESILVHFGVHQKLGKAHCTFTRKRKMKTSTISRKENSNPASNTYHCFIQGFACLVWVGRQVTCRTTSTIQSNSTHLPFYQHFAPLHITMCCWQHKRVASELYKGQPVPYQWQTRTESLNPK